MLPSPAILRTLVGDLRQVASVRRFVLADGPEAGIETLAFSTGGGLDFWVTAGRMMDIATLSWRGVQIGWQSPAGLRQPSMAATGSERRFSGGFGGFLNTCGFDHIRQPAGGRPLHGSAPFTPARLLAHGEDWDAAEPMLFCEGEVVVWSHAGLGHRLRRRIEAPIGGASLTIRDRVEIVGPQGAPILALYHFNLGYPLIGAGAEIRLEGGTIAGPLAAPEQAPAPPVLHATTSQTATCRVSGAQASIDFRWRSDTLPWLQLWRDLRPGSGALSVEPCTTGRAADGANEVSEPLQPGEGLSFEIGIALGDAESDSGKG